MIMSRIVRRQLKRSSGTNKQSMRMSFYTALSWQECWLVLSSTTYQKLPGKYVSEYASCAKSQSTVNMLRALVFCTFLLLPLNMFRVIWISRDVGSKLRGARSRISGHGYWKNTNADCRPLHKYKTTQANCSIEFLTAFATVIPRLK